MKYVLFFVTLVIFVLAGCSGDDDSGEGDIDTDTDTDADTDTDSDTDTDTDTDTDIDTDTDTDTDTDIDSDTDTDTDSDFVPIPIQSSVTHVQPMTGIVLWNDHGNSDAPEIQLEYSYVPFDDIAVAEEPSKWDWSSVENLLDDIASHSHQAVLRFYYVYPGQETTVPEYIKDLPDYNETTANSEGQPTDFPDWSHQALEDFTLEFYSQFSARYDDDQRMAFLQVGFGLWGEYHIYDPGEQLGVNFPTMEFQAEFFNHLSSVFEVLHWSISIDAADGSNAPFENQTALLDIRFGLFDDSFLHEEHDQYNADCFTFFGEEKRLESPVGGELSYYTNWDQEHALDWPDGPHGVSYEQLAADYNVSYMIGNDQPSYQTMERIEEAGMASGYNFEITAFEASSVASRVTVHNSGIAPIYYDAYVTVNGVRSEDSLATLLPGYSETFDVDSGGTEPILTIECDRITIGQEIEFDAEL